MAAPEPQIILHWDALGGFNFGALPGVRIVCVDERCPTDRVYHTSGGLSPEIIEAVVSGRVRDLSDAANEDREATP